MTPVRREIEIFVSGIFNFPPPLQFGALGSVAGFLGVNADHRLAFPRPCSFTDGASRK